MPVVPAVATAKFEKPVTSAGERYIDIVDIELARGVAALRKPNSALDQRGRGAVALVDVEPDLVVFRFGDPEARTRRGEHAIGRRVRQREIVDPLRGVVVAATDKQGLTAHVQLRIGADIEGSLAPAPVGSATTVAPQFHVPDVERGIAQLEGTHRVTAAIAQAHVSGVVDHRVVDLEPAGLSPRVWLTRDVHFTGEAHIHVVDNDLAHGVMCRSDLQRTVLVQSGRTAGARVDRELDVVKVAFGRHADAPAYRELAIGRRARQRQLVYRLPTVVAAPGC